MNRSDRKRSQTNRDQIIKDRTTANGLRNRKGRISEQHLKDKIIFDKKRKLISRLIRLIKNESQER